MSKARRKKTSTSQKKRKKPSKKADSRAAAKKPAKRKRAKRAAAGQRESDVPKFDLGEQVLAEQRKATAVKRKGPGSRRKAAVKEPEVESIGHTRGRRVVELSEEDQIIAQIVARDIEKLCGP